MIDTSRFDAATMRTPRDATRVVRRWWIAVLCALWVMAWPMLLLESTRGLPGLLGGSKDRGAYDMVAMLYTGSDAVLYGAIFLAGLVLFRLLLAIADLLDRDGIAWAAIRWAFGVRAVRAAVGLGAALFVAAVICPEDWTNALHVVSICAIFTIGVAPFLSGHPATLMRDADVGGWRPYWPGWRAAVVAGLLLLLCNPGFELLSFAVGEFAGGWAQALAELGMFPIEIVVALTAAAVWFGYRSAASLAQAWGAFRRRSFLLPYIAMDVYALVLAGLAVAPIIALTVIAIYIAPQYHAVTQATGETLPWLFRCLAHLGTRLHDMALIPAMPPVVFLTCFALGRLVFRNGLGGHLGPEAPGH